jgi:DNA-binding NtrC family response regulator
LDPQALKAIARYPWPGNVRELQTRIQRSVIIAVSRPTFYELMTKLGISKD